MIHPIFFYDDTCRFCRLWAARWKRKVGDHVEFRPFPIGEKHASSEFMDEHGQRSVGAEGVFRMLGRERMYAWPLVGKISEVVYKVVSSCRPCAYQMTKWLFKE